MVCVPAKFIENRELITTFLVPKIYSSFVKSSEAACILAIDLAFVCINRFGEIKGWLFDSVAK